MLALLLEIVELQIVNNGQVVDVLATARNVSVTTALSSFLEFPHKFYKKGLIRLRKLLGYLPLLD